MKEFFFHNLSACEVEAVDTRVQAAAVAFELYGLAAEVSFSYLEICDFTLATSSEGENGFVI